LTHWWVNPNPTPLVWVKFFNPNTIHLNKQVTRYFLHNPFNKQVVLGQPNMARLTCI